PVQRHDAGRASAVDGSRRRRLLPLGLAGSELDSEREKPGRYTTLRQWRLRSHQRTNRTTAKMSQPGGVAARTVNADSLAITSPIPRPNRTTGRAGQNSARTRQANVSSKPIISTLIEHPKRQIVRGMCQNRRLVRLAARVSTIVP